MKKLIHISMLVLAFLGAQSAFAQDGAKKSTYDTKNNKPITKSSNTPKKRTATPAVKATPKKQVSEKSKQVPQVKKL